MPERDDVWWTVGSATQALKVAALIRDNVARHALPVLESLSTVESLRRLWESGRAPGLTDFQRRSHLEELVALSKSNR